MGLPHPPRLTFDSLLASAFEVVSAAFFPPRDSCGRDIINQKIISKVKSDVISSGRSFRDRPLEFAPTSPSLEEYYFEGLKSFKLTLLLSGNSCLFLLLGQPHEIEIQIISARRKWLYNVYAVDNITFRVRVSMPSKTL